ncbi:hypothetical protein OpiT1DRAFT_03970 [Opitutaceae bacterium TAV1]|nr:hypothetical protein OpiT1DRAFT_03970 [Opitutaceae bacterium TAV1]
MIFSRIKPSFIEAMQANEVRALLPTDLDSAWLEELDPEIRIRARFSAKVESARHLSRLDEAVAQFTEGKIGWVEAKKNIRQSIEREGYVPDPEHRGGLQDLSSDARITLQLRMNVQQAQGYGHWKQGQNPTLLDAFPAQEFLRLASREKPRENWPERWLAAGGPRTSAWPRMIALKNDPCWVSLSRFGTPYPPFDYSSGMGVVDTPRREAEALGLITRDDIPQPQDLGFNDDLQASPGVRSQVLHSALEATGVGRFDKDGVFRAITGGAA